MKLIKVIFSSLLSLGFSLVGLLIALETVLPMWQDWQSMQHWQSAQAEIIELKAFDNQTIAKYSYKINGEPYSSTRVYVATFKDEIGRYQQDLQTRLKKFKQESLPIDIWVNPDNYFQAVIDRKMRWGLFILIFCFCSLFILIGLSLAYAFIRNSNKIRPKTLSITELKEEWDKKLDEPEFSLSFFEYSRQRNIELDRELERESSPAKKLDWQSRKGWEKSKIKSNAKMSLYFYWGFTLLWILLLFPVLFNFEDELNKSNSVIWWALLFPLAGIFLLWKAIKKTLQWRRFGEIYYEMDPYPGAIGGQVGGKILVPLLPFRQLQDKELNPELKLECVFSSNSGSDSDPHETIHWAQAGKPKLIQHGAGICFSFNYDIPPHLSESSVETRGSYYQWRLTLKFEVDGVDLNRTFVIPVFKSQKVSRFVSHNISEQVTEKKLAQSEQTKTAINKGDFRLAGLTHSMSVDDFGHSLTLYFPMFRNLLFSFILVFFTAGFVLFSYFIVYAALTTGYFGIILGIVSVPLILISLVIGISTIYLPLANLKVFINSDEVKILKRWFIIPIYWASMKLSAVNKINILFSGSRGSGVEKIENFKIEIMNTSGKKMIIGEGIEGKEVALLFAEYLAQRFVMDAEVVFVNRKVSRLRKNRSGEMGARK